MKAPLVSILIPAFNVEEFIVGAIRSAMAQTWPRKEIIVVDDGSTDRTAEFARRLASKDVKVVSITNQGQSAAVNHAYKICQGNFIQELDADDLLAPDKIEKQLTASSDLSPSILLSSTWAHFYYRTSMARFVPNSLWQDLSPVEWLIKKLSENLHMQPATWLVSRELAEAAGPWDVDLCYDQDGDYFSRVLLASEGTHFVRDAKVFYRIRGSSSVSYVGTSDAKKECLFRSIQRHVERIRSLEDSERVRSACVMYLQAWFGCFYPERPDLVTGMQKLAEGLGGHLDPPEMNWKYDWIRHILGRKAAKAADAHVQAWKGSFVRGWDKALAGGNLDISRVWTAEHLAPASRSEEPVDPRWRPDGDIRRRPVRDDDRLDGGASPTSRAR
jgi:glycosyltransferase involved in cell wall biosynthesis